MDAMTARTARILLVASLAAPGPVLAACPLLEDARAILANELDPDRIEQVTSDLESLPVLMDLGLAEITADQYRRRHELVSNCSDPELTQLLEIGQARLAFEGEGDEPDGGQAEQITDSDPSSTDTQETDSPESDGSDSEDSEDSDPDIPPQSEDAGELVALEQLVSANRWISALRLGSDLMPDYDEQGVSSGFQQQRFFGGLFAEARFERERIPEKPSADLTGLAGYDPAHRGRYGRCKWIYLTDVFCRMRGVKVDADNDDDLPAGFYGPVSATYSGIDVEFRSAPALREDFESSRPGEFNDIDDVIEASVFVNPAYPFLARAQRDSMTWGPILRAGITSREEAQDGDRIVEFLTLGMKFRYEDLRLEQKVCEQARGDESGKDGPWPDGCPVIHSFPRGTLEISAGYFEHFAGRDDELRWVVDFEYRLLDRHPAYAGVLANLGEGPDEVALRLSWLFRPDSILKLF